MALEPLLVLLFLLVVVIVVRLVAGGLDKTRIRDYLAQRGSRAETVSWSPFGRGWFGEHGDRMYGVTYRDADGARRAATFKTSMFSGVYSTEDRLLEPAPPTAGPPMPPEATEVELLRRENQRLRAELEGRQGRP